LSAINTSIDGHVHTKFCGHATGEMEEYVLAAIDKKLAGIVFLEHFEIGIQYFEKTWLTEDEFDAYFQEGERLREKYGSRLRVNLGVEIGYNPLYVEETLEFIGRYYWDRIGLSCHFLETEDGDHLNLVSKRKMNWEPLGEMGFERVAAIYFERLLEAVETLPGNVVCHLDAVLRHHPKYKISENNKKRALDVMDAMVAKGMALEINTSGFLHRGEPYPDRFFIEKAVKRRISLVAASDAHKPDQVGRYFDQLTDFI